MLAFLAFASFSVPIENPINSVIPLALLAFFTSLLIVSLLYMLSNFLQSPDLAKFARENLISTIFAGFIAVLFFLFFGIIGHFSSLIACENQCKDHLEVAKYGVEIVKSKIWSLYWQLYVFEIMMGLLSTLTFSVPLGALLFIITRNPIFSVSSPSLTFMPFAGLAPLVDAHTKVVDFVGFAMLGIIARGILIDFVANYMYIFFALGLVLRSFVFTKKTGASLLAIAAIAYFVYPLSVILTNYLLFEVYKPVNFASVPSAITFCREGENIVKIAELFNREVNKFYEAELSKVVEKPWYSKVWEIIKIMASTAYHTVSGTFNVLVSFFPHILYNPHSPTITFYNFLTPVGTIFKTFYSYVLAEIQIQIQFLVIVIVSFVLEIIISITSYRALAAFMEGETEIFGLTEKLI